jgi:hypothetical protein
VFYKYLKPYADQAQRREGAAGPDQPGRDSPQQ